MRIPLLLKIILPVLACILLTTSMLTGSAQIALFSAAHGSTNTPAARDAQARRISNPAAVYCTDMGYAYLITSDGAGGQSDTCSMPDGSLCAAWDFLEGKCGQPYSFCARQGYGLRVAADGKNPFSTDYAICVDRQGKDVGPATELVGLAAKLSQCAAPGDLQGPASFLVGTVMPDQEVSSTPMTPADSLPDSWDWRNATVDGVAGDWTTPVKNQSNCGSCWAFAAVGQTEAVLNLAAGNPNLDNNLSEEYLVSDCNPGGSCCGGWHDEALDFIYNQGIPDEACLPYVSGSCGCSSSGICSSNCSYKINEGCANSTCTQRCSNFSSRLEYIDSYGKVANDPAAIKQALITFGPLSVAMDVAMGDNYWVGDVFHCFLPLDVDHAVVIVGYDDIGEYWIVKNSWGTSYRENGYFKVGYGQCLIEEYVYYAHSSPITEARYHLYFPLLINQ
jgi:putative hemolysin